MNGGTVEWGDEISPVWLVVSLCPDARSCREQIEENRARLGLTLPVVDASGLSAPRARELLEGLAPDHPC